MGSNRFISCLLTLALLLGLAGCSGTPEPEAPPEEEPDTSSSQTAEEETVLLPLTLAYYPDYSLHPALAENRANLALAPLLYEGLFTVDSSFQAQPLLCQSYTVSEDSLVWTFTLREGVVFSDGTPLTGPAAAQALRTALGSGSRYSGRIPDLQSISGSGQTVTITLTRPNGDLPVLLDIPLALDSGTQPAGTGPYVLAWEAEELVLALRTDWWQTKSLPFSTIRLAQIRQADDLIVSFDSGDVTLLDVDLTGTNALGYSGSYEVWDYNTTDFLYLGFNTAKGYCADSQVRQAISRCIDRESITSIPYAGHASASALPVHPDSPYYDQALAAQAAYSPNILAQLLQGSSGPAQPLRLLVNSENNAKAAAAEYIAYQLQAAGLEVELEKLSWEDFVSALAAGNFDLYVGEVLLTADFDLSALLSSSGSLNYGGWRDSQTDALLSACSAAQGSQRAQCAGQLLSYLDEQAPIAPICFKNGSVLTQWGRLAGLDPRQNNIFNALEQWTLDE